jgi:hypothetical protein
MEEGMADECTAEIHASEAQEQQKAIKGEQKRRTRGQTTLLMIEYVSTG